jgi:hypothetical protein
LADEDAAIGTFDDGCDDLAHWGNVRWDAPGMQSEGKESCNQ